MRGSSAASGQGTGKTEAALERLARLMLPRQAAKAVVALVTAAQLARDFGRGMER